MDRNCTPEAKAFIWELQEGNVVIEWAGEKIIMNETCSIIWQLIDGVNSIQDIINEVIDNYGGELNETSYLISLVEESIKILQENNLVVLKEGNSFDGWLQYE